MRKNAIRNLKKLVSTVCQLFLYKLLLGCSEFESWIKVIDKIGNKTYRLIIVLIIIGGYS